MNNSSKNAIAIDDLKAGVIVEIIGPFSDSPYLARSLGNYGPGAKVYLANVESSETPESMASKFQNNQMPDCFVCWDHDINLKYTMSLVDNSLHSPAWKPQGESMQFDAQHSPVLSINAPEWFGEAEFLRWLNRRDRPLMTWHTRGEEPNEWSDIIVFVDPSLNGEGSECGEMPDKYWQVIVGACQSRFNPSTGFHVVVRITNLCE